MKSIAPTTPKAALVSRTSPAVGALARLVSVGVALAVVVACAGSSRAGTGVGAPVLASVDAGAPAGPRADVTPPDIAAVERMCALLTSCDKLPIPPSLVPDDFATCVKKMSDELTSAAAINFSLTLRECGLQSDSCSSLRACALHGANPESCVGRGKTGIVGYCDVDGRALTCWHEQPLAVRDCPRGGEQCLVVGGQATCSLGPCPATFAEGDKPRCSASGTRVLHCEKGKLASLDCAAFGLKCAPLADGAAGCATAGPGCSPGATPAPTRCEGNVAVGCVNGHEVKVNCASAGLACSTGTSAPGSSPLGACVAPPPATGTCDPGERPKCDEGVIKYCSAGRPRAFSCKAAGFGRCEGSKTGLRCAP